MGKTPHGHCRSFQRIILNVKAKEFQKTKVKKISPSPNMKHNHNHDNAAAPGLVPVRFEFTNPTATTVCVAGSFNHWQPEAKTLHSSGVGNWWKETALAPGTYEYCLVVDGQWMPDPLVAESVPNPFGGRNSVLHVSASPTAAHLAGAENLPLIQTNELKTNKNQ
jgi:1,4-alpha-glucan branching enzyme